MKYRDAPRLSRVGASLFKSKFSSIKIIKYYVNVEIQSCRRGF